MTLPANSGLTAELARSFLAYAPETGILRWKARSGHSRIGSVAGCIRPDGYMHIQLFKRRYQSHRVIWLLIHGYWPMDQVDHINGDRADNRISNLRLATPSENQQNMRMKARGSSGFIGCSRIKNSHKWLAHIGCNGRSIYLGRFETPEEAQAAYFAAKAKYHKFQPIPRI